MNFISASRFTTRTRKKLEEDEPKSCVQLASKKEDVLTQSESEASAAGARNKGKKTFDTFAACYKNKSSEHVQISAAEYQEIKRKQAAQKAEANKPVEPPPKKTKVQTIKEDVRDYFVRNVTNIQLTPKEQTGIKLNEEEDRKQMIYCRDKMLEKVNNQIEKYRIENMRKLS